MPVISSDGLVTGTANDTTITATQSIIAKLGDAAGARIFEVQDSGGGSAFKVESDGDSTVSGILTVTDNIIASSAVTVSEDLSVSGNMTSTRITITQTSHGFTIPTAGVRPVVYNDGTGMWELAKADVETTAADEAIIEIVDTNNFRVANRGYHDVASHGLSVGFYYVLSDATAGALVREDLFVGTNKQRILFAVDANRIKVLVDPMIVP